VSVAPKQLAIPIIAILLYEVTLADSHLLCMFAFDFEMFLSGYPFCLFAVFLFLYFGIIWLFMLAFSPLSLCVALVISCAVVFSGV